MLTTLAVSNYRSLRHLVVPLARLNVVTGANGTGKSTFYRSLRLLADAAGNGAVAALAREGGLPSALWAGPDGPTHRVPRAREGTVRGRPVSLKIGFGSTELSYSVDLGYPKPGDNTVFHLDPEIKRECIWAGPVWRPGAVLVDRSDRAVVQGDGGGTVSIGRLQPYDSVLSEFAGADDAPEIAAVRATIRSWRFYDRLRTDEDAPARQARIGTRTPVLAADGSNLAAAVQTVLEIGDGPAFEQAVDRAFPGSEVAVDIVGGRFELTLSTPGVLRPMRSAEMSDGTIRFLAMACALLSPRPPGLLVLNEPETSMHPSLFGALGELVDRAAERSQIVLVSHAEPLVTAVTRTTAHPLQLLELAKTKGETRVRDQDILDEPAWRWPTR